MIRAISVQPAGHWREASVDCVVLDFDERHRRRVTMTGVQGLAYLLDLPDAVMLRDGDALVLEDGRLVEVVAAPEALVEVKGRAATDLVRLAWHIGNRHLPAQIMPTAIRLRRDHVIEDMLRGLGARLVMIEAPFDPEGGAYAVASQEAHAAGHAGHGHGHDAHGAHDHAGHGHDDHHGHAHHDHRHDHDHHDHAHKHGHRHD